MSASRFSNCKECGHLTSFDGRPMRKVRERLGLCNDCCRKKYKDRPSTPTPLMQAPEPTGYQRCPWSGKLVKIKGQK